MLYLMRCGYIMPVLDYVRSWPKTVDQGLLRHFVAQVKLLHLGFAVHSSIFVLISCWCVFNQVIDMIEPPYSAEFLRLLLRIVQQSTDAFRTASADSSLHEVLDHFIGASSIFAHVLLFSCLHLSLMSQMNVLGKHQNTGSQNRQIWSYCRACSSSSEQITHNHSQVDK